MQRSFLVFAMAFVALMAGALFYAARYPVATTVPVAPVNTPAAVVMDGPVFPAFQLTGLDGNQHDFSQWAGKHRLVNFWATWCAPCRREIPLLKTFQEEYGENGFHVIGIAVDFADQVAKYAESVQFNYPVLVGQDDAMAVAEISGIDFIGLPFTMIVASDGELLNSHIGEIVEADLEHIVRVLTMLDNGEIDKDSARKALDFL